MNTVVTRDQFLKTLPRIIKLFDRYPKIQFSYSGKNISEDTQKIKKDGILEASDNAHTSKKVYKNVDDLFDDILAS